MSTIVIGAGLAGLTAARRLRQADEEVVVLEATAFLGGRTRTLRDRLLHGQPADLGASMIDIGNDVILRACRDLGVALTPRFSLFPSPDPEGGVSGATLVRNELVLDSVRVDNETRARIASEIRCALDEVPPAPVETLPAWAARVGLSMLATQAFCAQAGLNPTTLPWSTQVSHVHPPAIGKLCWMLADGTDSLAHAIADGVDVRREQPVRLVSYAGLRVAVETDDDVVQADDVIVAAPVRTTLRIAFEPVLPPWKVNALLGTPMTQGGKLAAQYTAGTELVERMGPGILSDGPVAFVWGRPVGPEDTVVLHALVPDRGDGVLRDEEAALANLDHLVRVVVGNGPQRIAGMLQDWTSEEYIRGVVSDLSADPDGQPGQLAHGVGNVVHFAGEHTADVWATGMEGAMRSGLRAADEVLVRR